MDDRPQSANIYRPWTMIALSGAGLAAASIFIGRTVWIANQDGDWSQIRYLLPVLVGAALLTWTMGNRLVLTTDSLDSRYLWQSRQIRRSDIVCVHDIKLIRGATSATFILNDDSAVAVTWPGAAGKALAAWCEGLVK